MTLPQGFRVRLHDDVRRLAGGRVLVGGSPLRVLRLSARAAALLRGAELVVDGPDAAVVAERLLEGDLALPVLDPTRAARPDELTVVVPVRDRADQLARCLAALEGLRTIVVDDASERPEEVAAAARRPGVRLLRLEENRGPAGARNAGLHEVATPYVAFVDCDVEVMPGVLLALTAHFADPRVVLVGPHLRSGALAARPSWIERYESASPALGLGSRGGVVRPGGAVAWLPSACLVGRTHRLAEVGFDDRLRVGEDVDLVWRLVDGGDRVRYDPGHVAVHAARPTVRPWAARKFVYGTGGAGLAARHPEHVMTAVLSPAMALAAAALLARRTWSLPVAAAALGRAVAVLDRSLPDLPERRRTVWSLAARGLGWGVRQESALVLRHWWPATAVLALPSRSVRRVVVSALVVDAVTTSADPGPLVAFAGRRLDDLAYGAGLWWGALRAGSARCLRVRLLRGARPAPGGPRRARP